WIAPADLGGADVPLAFDEDRDLRPVLGPRSLDLRPILAELDLDHRQAHHAQLVVDAIFSGPPAPVLLARRTHQHNRARWRRLDGHRPWREQPDEQPPAAQTTLFKAGQAAPAPASRGSPRDDARDTPAPPPAIASGRPAR